MDNKNILKYSLFNNCCSFTPKISYFVIFYHWSTYLSSNSLMGDELPMSLQFELNVSCELKAYCWCQYQTPCDSMRFYWIFWVMFVLCLLPVLHDIMVSCQQNCKINATQIAHVLPQLIRAIIYSSKSISKICFMKQPTPLEM